MRANSIFRKRRLAIGKSASANIPAVPTSFDARSNLPYVHLARDDCLTIAVNISPIQFMHPGLVDDVEQLLAKFGLYPARLEFEIANDLLIRGAH